MRFLKKLNEQETMELAQKEWSTEGMQKYLFQTYDFYKTNDGLIFEVQKANKLGINKTIWYDDELPTENIPRANFDNFVLNNTYNCDKYIYYAEEFNKNTKFYFCKNNSNISYIDYEYRQSGVDNIIREISKEEMQEILGIYKQQRDAYINRLEKYYKRYGQHITSRGYWVNR